MRLVVLGGTGFIGSHVVDHLLAAGHSVCAVSRQPEAPRAQSGGIDYLHLDLRQRAALDALVPAIEGADAVLHMVSTTLPGTGDLDPRTDVADNLVSLVGVMELMLSLGNRRLIYLSSGGTVYGLPTTVPIPEDHPLRPINSYGIVKVAAESYVGLFARTKGLSPVILRPSNPYGDRQGRAGSQGLVNTLLRRAQSGEAIEVWGDGTVVRDYLHVQDLARLVVLAAESSAEGTFNAGSGVGTSVREMIDLAASVTGHQLETVYRPGRSVDVPVSILDRSAAQATFGWSPRIDLREGVARTWDWLQTQTAAP
jgi:UDP-glucose 4-epimerase